MNAPDDGRNSTTTTRNIFHFTKDVHLENLVSTCCSIEKLVEFIHTVYTNCRNVSKRFGEPTTTTTTKK